MYKYMYTIPAHFSHIAPCYYANTFPIFNHFLLRARTYTLHSPHTCTRIYTSHMQTQVHLTHDPPYFPKTLLGLKVVVKFSLALEFELKLEKIRTKKRAWVSIYMRARVLI